MRPSFAAALPLALAACGSAATRDLDEVQQAFLAPKGALDKTTAPKVFEATRHMRAMDAAAAVLPYFAPTATMNYALAEERKSPYLCVPSLAAAQSQRLSVEGNCLDGEAGSGRMDIALEREGALVRRLDVTYDGMCVRGACLTGAQAVRFDLAGFHQEAVSAFTVDATVGSATHKLDGGYRSRVKNDQVFFDWTVFLGDEEGADNIVLSARADSGAGQLLATDVTGEWDCEYQEGGAKGICQPRCSDAELVARRCCTCRKDEIESGSCGGICPESTPRRTVLW